MKKIDDEETAIDDSITEAKLFDTCEESDVEEADDQETEEEINLRHDLKQERDTYIERLDAGLIHYKKDEANEKCVQRAICEMIRDMGIKCEREATPCPTSKLRMDLSGPNYIVEVKMGFKSISQAIAQLSYYAKKKQGEKRLFLAVHCFDTPTVPWDEYWECDEEYITLVKAEECAYFLNERLKRDGLTDCYQKRD